MSQAQAPVVKPPANELQLHIEYDNGWAPRAALDVSEKGETLYPCREMKGVM
jgi:hypothetical protein